MKKLTIAVTMFALSVFGQVTITSPQWNYGTNGFSIFSATVHNASPSMLYMWQSSTNMTDGWTNEFSGLFQGTGVDWRFIYVIDSGNTNKFFRIVEVGSVP